jgi:hypothetical protein
MAKQKIQLAIPEPCHENWEGMTPEQKGRFCGVCSKTVVDFSMMSDGQVLETLQQAAGGLCGRFHTDQLQRTLVEPVKPKWYMKPIWQYVVGAFLFLKAMPARAQKPATQQCTPQQQPRLMGKPAIMGRIATPPVAPQQQTVKGKVTSTEGSAVANAIVTAGKEKVITDANGAFELKVKKGDVVTVSAAGYGRTQLLVNEQTYLAVRLNPVIVPHVTMGIVAVAPAYTVQWQVKDADGNGAVSGAAIELKNEYGASLNRLTTNSKGFGSSKTYLHGNEKLQVVVSAPGYETDTIELSAQKLTDNQKTDKQLILLKRAAPEFLMGDTIIMLPHVKPAAPPEKTLTQLALEAVQRAGELAKKADKATVTPVATTPTVIGEKPLEQKKPVNTEFKETVTLKIQPNPAKRGNPVNIHLQTSTSETMMLQVTEADGKILHQQKLNAVKGSNLVSLFTSESWGGKILFIKLMNARGQWAGSGTLVME